MIHNIVVASSNKGKIEEIANALDDLPIKLIPQDSLQIEGAEETACTFIENAILKARHASQQAGLPALADDSGIEVDALNGAPGVYTARYAGVNATDLDNNQKLLQALDGIEENQRSARYRCVMVYLKHPKDPSPMICQATWEGRILTSPQGTGGFGYDPIFYAPETNCAVAELHLDVKMQHSHRGKVLKKLHGAFERLLAIEKLAT